MTEQFAGGSTRRLPSKFMKCTLSISSSHLVREKAANRILDVRFTKRKTVSII